MITAAFGSQRPVNDAGLVADTLQSASSPARRFENANRADTVKAIQKLGNVLAELGAESVGLYYFSGH
jgi:HD-like signal output (HDOD) protein